MICRRCGKEISGNVCPYCGTLQDAVQENNTQNNGVGVNPINQGEVNPVAEAFGTNSGEIKPVEIQTPVINQVDVLKEETPIANPVAEAFETNKEMQKPEVNKQKSKIGLYLILAIIVLGAIVGGYYVIKNKPSKTSSASIKETLVEEAFMLSNGSKYAVFNTSGKQITDFIYDNNAYFKNGIAHVTSNRVGSIITKDGKILDTSSTDRYVTMNGPLYTAQENGSYVHYNYKGEKVATYSEYGLIGPTTSYLLLAINGEYKLLNKEGKEILNVTKVDDINTYQQAGIEEKYGYVLVYLQGKNYIYDISNDKKIAEFTSNSQYCMSELEDDIVLEHCKDLKSTLEKDIKLFKEGKVYDMPLECRQVSYYGTQLMCDTSEGKKLLTSNYQVGRLYKGTSYEEFFDEDTYAIRETGKMVFYKNGKEVASNDKLTVNLGYFANPQVKDFYILYNSQEKLYYAYDQNGKQLFNTAYSILDRSKDTYRVKPKDGKMYLMDKNGKKLTSEYTNIYKEVTINDTYYYVTIDNTKKILDKNEKVLYECSDCSDIYVKTYLGNDYAVTKKEVANLKTKKVIVSSTNVTCYDQYIKAGDKYYTYTGKLYF